MRILFIAPIPPPITGQSLAAKVILDDLVLTHNVVFVNLSKQSFINGAYTFKRFLDISKILREIYNKQKKCDLVYLTISESLAGNIKDLFIYLICYKMLSKTYIHLHGGSIKKKLFDRYPIFLKINKFFLCRLGGIIVLGQSHVSIYTDFIDKNKIYIVANSAEEKFFIDEQDFKEKFANNSIIRILFLGNLISGKGHNELVDAFISLDSDIQKQICIDFAGAFESEHQKMIFLEKIKPFGQISYHGIVHGEVKKSLLSAAHIFCLPTSLLEGQPISILEAYASGCVVISTVIGGIGDIFQDKINGFQISEKSTNAIASAIQECIQSKDRLVDYAKFNSQLARKKYRASIYKASVRKVLGFQS